MMPLANVIETHEHKGEFKELECRYLHEQPGHEAAGKRDLVNVAPL
jgi:hypothetical protein